MADFKETLSIERNVLPCGAKSLFYSYAIAKEDLASGETTVIDFSNQASLGEVCKVLDDFESSSLEGRKLAIQALLQADKINVIEEY